MNDPEATQRYRRKIEKDDAYIHAVMHLGHVSGIEIHRIYLSNYCNYLQTTHFPNRVWSITYFRTML